MPEFRVETVVEGGVGPTFIYNSDESSISFEDGTPVDLSHLPSDWVGDEYKSSSFVSASAPGRKSGALKLLKIQLGLSCNYSCSYCSQRFVPHADSTNKNDIDNFMAQLEKWLVVDDDGEELGVEFWGGEPFVYWKTLKPLAEAIKSRYPLVSFWMPSNGSLLDDEKVEWLDRMDFSISISHDGPGQSVRGPDPLDDPACRDAILKLFARFHPQGRISFNAMMNRRNMSRKDVVEFFQQLTGASDVAVGEGAFIGSYDEGGLESSLLTQEDQVAFRRLALSEVRSQTVLPDNVRILQRKVGEFIRTIINAKPIEAIGQKCGMDREDRIAVDLRGNVLTCQNVSAAATAPNGKSHKIGHVSALDEVRLDTATSWHHRKDCRTCPVIHLCGGSCMFLEGQLWDVSCDNAFSDNIVFFAWAFEIMTGCVPIRILGGREDREDLWEVKSATRKKVIPIRLQQ